MRAGVGPTSCSRTLRLRSPSVRVDDRCARRNVSLTPYGTFEAGYDSRYRSIDRQRLSVGAARKFSSHVMRDTYAARVRDSRGGAARVSALGMTLNLTC
jgi:hypothetical protein